MPAAERQMLRQEHAGAILADLKAWIETTLSETEACRSDALRSLAMGSFERLH